MASRYPNFLFIGPDKAGSTWLYQALGEHEEVFLPKAKELFFFDRFYDKGWTWYLKFFNEGSATHRIVGEISHDYLFSRIACTRIANNLPSAKLMVCLREPVQRAFSAYLYLVRQGRTHKDFKSAIEEFDELIDHGRYAKHLSPYFDHFERDQIYIAAFDDLAIDPQGYFDNVCRFLKIKSMSISDDYNRKILPAARPRSHLVARIVRRVGWQARCLGLPTMVTRFKESNLLLRILFSPYERHNKPSISSEMRDFLHEVFLPETRDLDALIGSNFCSRWGYLSS